MPSDPPIAIRPLAGADLSAVARIHCDAFVSSSLTCFGESLVREYYEWQLVRLPALTGYVAAIGDRIAGYAFCADTFLSPATFLASRPGRVAKAFLLRPGMLIDPRMLRIVAYASRSIARAWQGGKQAGTPQAGPSPRVFWVEAVAVERSEQGRGIGARLMQRCAEHGFSQGFPEVYLAVETCNLPAIALYEKLGWTRVLKQGTWNGRMKLSPRPAASSGMAC